MAFTSGREAFAVGLALATRMGELESVHVLVPTPAYDFGWYDEGWQDSFDIIVRMPTATCQEAVDSHRVDLDPGSLIPFMDVEAGDVLLAEVSPPDDKGFCGFGASLWAKKRQVRESKLVIAEVNDRLIKTCGENFIHVSELDYLVEHISSGIPPGSGSLAGRALKEPEPYLKQIADYVSELIQDGDTLQIGVGRTTEPLVNLGIFDNKQDIGWHSEATPPGVISRVKSGLINGKRKTINTGIAVVTSIGGSSMEEMNWVSENPLIQLVDVSYLEDMRVIGAHDNFVALNNALLVDLTGQIGSQTIGTREMSAAGGQIPFVFGSWLSKNGRAITVMPSTARDGTISRIYPLLPEGTVVTIQRNCADYIVTEYGIAHVKGKSVRKRAEELINIAHPDFRGELRKEAKRLYG